VKKIFDKLKLFIDAWKMWLFFGVLIGTNAGQQVYYSEPEKEPLKPVHIVKTPTKPQKTIIIHKFDIELVKKLIKQELDKHKQGSQH